MCGAITCSPTCSETHEAQGCEQDPVSRVSPTAVLYCRPPPVLPPPPLVTHKKNCCTAFLGSSLNGSGAANTTWYVQLCGLLHLFFFCMHLVLLSALL